MSFTLVLQTNTSEAAAFDKQLTTQATLTGVLKIGTSITDPVITIETTPEIIAASNYITIDTFGRKYFITGVKSVRTNLWEVSAHVDVLASFKTAILANKAIVARNEKKYNLYLDDGEFRVYNNPIVTTKIFPATEFSTSNATYVLAMAGKTT